jgi:hypothetical protein
MKQIPHFALGRAEQENLIAGDSIKVDGIWIEFANVRRRRKRGSVSHMLLRSIEQHGPHSYRELCEVAGYKIGTDHLKKHFQKDRLGKYIARK